MSENRVVVSTSTRVRMLGVMSTVVELLSNPFTFLKNRPTNESIISALLVFNSLLGIQILIVQKTLALAGASLASKMDFTLMSALFVYFLSAAGHFGMKMAGIKQRYKDTLRATFFLWSPLLVLAGILVLLLYRDIVLHDDVVFLPICVFTGLSLYWILRAWRATCRFFGASWLQTVIAFLLANILYVPIMIAFTRISSVLGRIILL